MAGLCVCATTPTDFTLLFAPRSPRWLGVTQFEMTFARRAFPCFDEPGLRATFSLTLQHDKDVSVQSNTRPSIISRGCVADCNQEGDEEE